MLSIFQTVAQYIAGPLSFTAVPASAATGAPAANGKMITTTQQTQEEQGLFSLDLVSPEVAAQLPPGYRFRALRRSDYATGFLDCLRVLTTVGDITEEEFAQQYDSMDAQEGYYIMVIEDTARTESPVVATGALMVERKL